MSGSKLYCWPYLRKSASISSKRFSSLSPVLFLNSFTLLAACARS